MAGKVINQLCAGDIILYPPHKDDVLANLIAMFTGGTVNHAAILYTAGGDDQKVIESVLEGVRFNPIRPTSDEYRAKVMRMKQKVDMTPVLDASVLYLGNKYPYIALGLLAILLLFGKRKPTAENKLLYSAMEYVTLGLMLTNQRIVGKGKKIMTCSQFTAQAFSDAGKDYALHFNHLIVDDFLYEPAVLTSSSDGTFSLTDTVPLYEELEKYLHESGENGKLLTENYVYEGLANICQGVACLPKTVLEIGARSGNETDAYNVQGAQKRLLSVLDKMITGNTGRQVKAIIDDFQSDTYRNFFVTPEDLFNGNCDSIEYIGEY